jgi:hypothetical protein
MGQRGFMIAPHHGLRWVDSRVDEWTRGCGTERLLEHRDAVVAGRAGEASPPRRRSGLRRVVDEWRRGRPAGR